MPVLQEPHKNINNMRAQSGHLSPETCKEGENHINSDQISTQRNQEARKAANLKLVNQ